MKTAVSSYSFGPYQKSLGNEGIMKKAKEMGFDGIEFIDSHIASLDEAKALRALAKELDIEICAFCVGADLANNDASAEIAKLKSKVDIAEALGTPLMRHDVTWGVGSGAKVGISYDALIPKIIPAIREVTEYAKARGIRTLTENHGRFSQDADRVEKLINEVNNENFGALVDVGNFMCADEDPWKSVAKMMPYAYHVHVKDFFLKSGQEPNPGKGWFLTRGGDYLRGTIVGHGVARVYQSIATVKRSGYDGFVSIEFEGMEDNLKGIELGLENLKKVWDAV